MLNFMIFKKSKKSLLSGLGIRILQNPPSIRIPFYFFNTFISRERIFLKVHCTCIVAVILAKSTYILVSTCVTFDKYPTGI